MVSTTLASLSGPKYPGGEKPYNVAMVCPTKRFARFLAMIMRPRSDSWMSPYSLVSATTGSWPLPRMLPRSKSGPINTNATMAMTPRMAIIQRSCLRKSAKGLAMRKILANHGRAANNKP